jgi:putative transposase
MNSPASPRCTWWNAPITAERIVTELRAVFTATGGPAKVQRMDTGPELISQALQRFCGGEVAVSYIPPGSP